MWISQVPRKPCDLTCPITGKIDKRRKSGEETGQLLMNSLLYKDIGPDHIKNKRGEKTQGIV